MPENKATEISCWKSCFEIGNLSEHSNVTVLSNFINNSRKCSEIESLSHQMEYSKSKPEIVIDSTIVGRKVNIEVITGLSNKIRYRNRTRF